MDLVQLEYFMTVAKYENITKAARELYVAQPTLSQSISRLEDTLGVELFERKKGKLYLNEAGELFLNRVKNVFSELNAGLSELETYKEHRQDWVYIASSVIDIFKVILMEYHELHPEIHIDHSLTYDRGIVDLLLGGTVDFAITPTPIREPKVDCIPLYQEEVFAVVGKVHPLASLKEVSIETLRSYPLICNSCDSDIRFMENLFHTNYRNLDILASSSEGPIPRDLTIAGYGVGFLPGRVAVKHLKNPNTDQHPIRLTPRYFRTTCISMKHGHQLSPAAEGFYRYILSFCQKDSAEVDAFLREYYGD
jgi:DNA-binding transcriptional LysR family regulator